MKINQDKTKYIIFETRKKKIETHLTIKFNNIAINQTDCYNYLGINLDEKLNFKFHINQIKKKVIISYWNIQKIETYKKQ